MISGLVYGILFTVIFVHLQRRAVKKLEHEVSEESMKVRHTRELYMRLSYENSYDLLLDSIKSLKNWKIKKEDRSEGIICIKTAINWKTFGEYVTIKIIKLDSVQTKVEISSKPIVPTTLIDLGRNLENVDTICNILNNNVI
jgi:hypothetical protein